MRTEPAPALRLIYVHDPLCGWCYAAAPLIRAAAAIPGIRLELFAGGLFSGRRRQPLTPALREHIRAHDARIAELSGQPFGAPYVDGLLRDAATVFDSLPPIAAVLVAEELGGRGLALLERIQHAHYVDGRSVGDAAVLTELAAAGGLPPAVFKAALANFPGDRLQAHLDAAADWLRRGGGNGYPTLLLCRADGVERLDLAACYGRPDAFRATLAAAAATAGGRPP